MFYRKNWGPRSVTSSGLHSDRIPPQTVIIMQLFLIHWLIYVPLFYLNFLPPQMHMHIDTHPHVHISPSYTCTQVPILMSLHTYVHIHPHAYKPHIQFLLDTFLHLLYMYYAFVGLPLPTEEHLAA